VSLIDHPRPAFEPDAARQLLAGHFGIEGTLAPLASERDQNFHVGGAHGQFTFKIVNAAEPESAMAFQAALLRHVETHAPDLPLPRVVAALDGHDVPCVVGPTGERHLLRVVTFLPGVPLATVADGPHALAALRGLGRVLGRLDAVLGSFGHPGAFRAFDWNIRQALDSRARLPAIRDDVRRGWVASFLDGFESRVAPRLPHVRHSVVHNDANDWNVLVDAATGAVTGLIDVGDAVFAPTVADLAVACAYATLGGDDRIARVAAVVTGYHEAFPLTIDEVRLLPDLIAARLAMSVSISALRQTTSHDPYLFVSEGPAWQAIDWLSAGGARELGEACTRATTSPTVLPARMAAEAVRAARTRLLSRNLSLSYKEPLHIVEGNDVWLSAADGRRYLDCYNNVAHVGHCHPRVVAALTAQASRLNTNTRYLHENVVAYAERLKATLPPSLDTFFFVNSGSEANDLALRIARAATGRTSVVVLDWAYHGHTQALIEVSPYKYKRAGGSGRPPFVIELALPDPYRAPDDWRTFEHGARFAAEARRRLSDAVPASGAPAAFIAETIPSVGGQIFLPDDYLAEVYDGVRALGGVCIADEVQVGFGRVGTHMWAFQEHGVVPDIATMGKPAGAGHPLGIVVTTRALADAFANGMEYFNTFGGNPVSCAVGLAVLDVLEGEHLLDNARTEGEYLLGRFRALVDRHACLGEVRGRGLFFGLEVVSDRRTKAHDGQRASAAVNRAKDLGVLLGTDGPHDNVIKIRPPMTFRREHSDLLVNVLDRALSATSGRAW
jgi:4-aminobutyrate aminotransferase-like enzyme/Ser/Thr protein kinase RdoA (MazF antagonist)